MNDIRSTSRRWGSSIRWIARLSSLAINSVFLLVLILAITNEDRPQRAAIPLLILLVATMLGSLLAWRWEKAGGIAVTLGAIILGCVAYFTAPTVLDSRSFLPPLVYGVPFLVVGILFWLAGQAAKRGDAA
jgi:xanthine/uracil permease